MKGVAELDLEDHVVLLGYLPGRSERIVRELTAEGRQVALCAWDDVQEPPLPAEPTVLSRGLTQPALVGPRFGGFPRAIYTIGVTGCGQKRTYNVTCNDETTCFAGDGS